LSGSRANRQGRVRPSPQSPTTMRSWLKGVEATALKVPSIIQVDDLARTSRPAFDMKIRILLSPRNKLIIN